MYDKTTYSSSFTHPDYQPVGMLVVNFWSKNSETSVFSGGADYQPFGMLAIGRYWDWGGYRWGFQGQEMENELFGFGNASFFKYRISDNRTGRFHTPDKMFKDYPFYSSYAFSGNRVIDAIEQEGLQPSNYYANLYMNTAGLEMQTQRKLEAERGKQALAGMAFVTSALSFGYALPAMTPTIAQGILGAQSVAGQVTGGVSALMATYPRVTGGIMEGVSAYLTFENVILPFSSGSLLPSIGGTALFYITTPQFSQGLEDLQDVFTPSYIPKLETSMPEIQQFAPAVSTSTQTPTVMELDTELELDLDNTY